MRQFKSGAEKILLTPFYEAVLVAKGETVSRKHSYFRPYVLWGGRDAVYKNSHYPNLQR